MVDKKCLTLWRKCANIWLITDNSHAPVPRTSDASTAGIIAVVIRIVGVYERLLVEQMPQALATFISTNVYFYWHQGVLSCTTQMVQGNIFLGHSMTYNEAQ